MCIGRCFINYVSGFTHRGMRACGKWVYRETLVPSSVSHVSGSIFNAHVELSLSKKVKVNRELWQTICIFPKKVAGGGFSLFLRRVNALHTSYKHRLRTSLDVAGSISWDYIKLLPARTCRDSGQQVTRLFNIWTWGQETLFKQMFRLMYNR